jgi:endonuclease/exonuclease/phosphatase (EEP) superfamily protein YafD
MPASNLAARAATAGLVAAGLATAAALLAFAGWPFELFSHFRLQLGAGSLALVACLVLLRRPRAAACAAALAAVNLVQFGAPLRAAERAGSCAGPGFVVVSANLLNSNADHAPYVRWLAAHPADLVVAQEVTPDWARDLASLRAYPYRRVLAREDPYGLAILSRWPFEALEPVDLAGDGLPSLEGVLQVAGQRVHVLALHTRWPVTPALAAARDRALLRAAVRARASALPTIATGDLNVTPDSPVFDQVLEDSGLRDVFAGQPGWHPTWMAGFWPLALRIDHTLVSPPVCVELAEVGPELGSDHRPVTARLRLPPAP